MNTWRNGEIILKKVSDKETRTLGNMGTSKPFLIGTYSVLFLVAVVMTIATDKGLLTVATGAFAILIFFLWVPTGSTLRKHLKRISANHAKAWDAKPGVLAETYDRPAATNH